MVVSNITCSVHIITCRVVSVSNDDRIFIIDIPIHNNDITLFIFSSMLQCNMVN